MRLARELDRSIVVIGRTSMLAFLTAATACTTFDRRQFSEHSDRILGNVVVLARLTTSGNRVNCGLSIDRFFRFRRQLTGLRGSRTS